MKMKMKSSLLILVMAAFSPTVSSFDFFSDNITNMNTNSSRELILNDLEVKFSDLNLTNNSTPFSYLRERFNGAALVGGTGTIIGGGNTAEFFDGTWCRDLISLLRIQKDHSKMRLNATQSYFEANKILIMGLREAYKKSISLNGDKDTFTKRGIIKGLKLVQNLGMLNSSANYRKHFVFNHLLNKYYDQLLNVVVLMDLEVVIPTLNEDESLGLDIDEMEKRFVDLSLQELKWVNDVLTSKSFINGEYVITPKGSARTYLKALELFTESSAKGLHESLWQYRFACATNSLLNLNEMVKQYNLGNTGLFTSDRYAINYSYTKIQEILNQINNNDSCL